MTEIILLSNTFALVFALCLQSLNGNNRHQLDRDVIIFAMGLGIHGADQHLRKAANQCECQRHAYDAGLRDRANILIATGMTGESHD